MFDKLNSKKNIQIYVVLFVIIFFIGKVSASQPTYIELEVNYNNYTPVNMKKYGVNGALLGSKMSYGSDQLIEAYNKLGIPFTRFPGGTIGNYYNWTSGNFSCDKEPDEKAVKRIERMNRTLKRTSGSYSVNDFFHFVKATGTEFTYMLNILCDSVENNKKLLTYMKQSDVDLKFLELGNEIYSGGYSWLYKDAASYIKAVEVNYKVIKEVYPDAKIGLVVTPISFSGNSGPEPNGKPNRSWPKKLRDFDVLSANSLFSDALVIHVYGHPYKNKLLKSDPVTFEEHFLTVMDHFNNKFDVSMQYLEALGNKKPVWITEWGISAPISKRKGLFKDYKKSAFHALYVASVLSSITLEKNVEVANYHIIRDLWRSTKKGYEITDVGKVLSTFIDSATSSNMVYEVVVNSNISGVKALMYATKRGDELFIVNENNKRYIINKLITKNNFSNYKVESMSIINDEFMIDSNIYKNDLDSAAIEIKPYSILRIIQINHNNKLN